MTTTPLKLYRHPLSGHSHRAQLALSLMDLPHQLIDVDLAQGAHKAPAFLKLNPSGQVPVLDDHGTIVHDSNAILVYLATTYDKTGRWLPRDPKTQAGVQRWLSAAAGPLAFGAATARLISVFGMPNLFRVACDPQEVIGRAHGLLKAMDSELAARSYLVDPTATLADLAMYSYTVNAPEGHVDLQPYRHVRNWLGRVEALPGFVPFQKTAVGLAA